MKNILKNRIGANFLNEIISVTTSFRWLLGQALGRHSTRAPWYWRHSTRVVRIQLIAMMLLNLCLFERTVTVVRQQLLTTLIYSATNKRRVVFGRHMVILVQRVTIAWRQQGDWFGSAKLLSGLHGYQLDPGQHERFRWLGRTLHGDMHDFRSGFGYCVVLLVRWLGSRDLRNGEWQHVDRSRSRPVQCLC